MLISPEVVTETLLRVIDKLDFSDKSMLPSDWAEKHIILDSAISSLKQGKFSYALTPYLKEPVDCASPYHPAKLIAIIKGAQLGMSQGVIVPAILWKIANDPGNIVSLSANDSLSKRFVEERIDPIISRCFVKDLIRPSTIRKKNARTGDTSTSKEFAGGAATFGGLQSMDKIGKQKSYALGFYDDWEAAKVSDKDQGNVFELLQQRFSSAANTMKQYFISTPETRPSNIELIYNMGDKRQWMLPCPCCGEYIDLLWFEKIDDEYFGVIFEKDKNGRLIEDTVRYKCQECGGEFKEKEKYKMNQKGRWTPTCEPMQPGYYSYRISCLYGAPGMFGWTDYAYRWLRIFQDNEKGDLGKLKAFKNLVLGEPWEEEIVSVNANQLTEHTREYEVGVIPNELSETDGNDQIVLLTLGCDLNGTENDARLDWEVMAHSMSGSVYSIDQGSIGTYQRGDKSRKQKEAGERDLWTYRHDEPNSVWGYFENEILMKDFPVDDGRTMRLSIACVDHGYLSHLVNQFVERHPGLCIAVKGKDKDKYSKPTQDIKKFKMSKESVYLYLLEVDRYKDDLSTMMAIDWDKNSEFDQPAGYVNYPTPNYQQGKYTVNYFKELTVEEKELQIDERTGEMAGWRWVHKKKSIGNHFWDCEVYNIAGKDIFLHNFIKEYNKHEKEKVEPTWFSFVQILKEKVL